jgi:energy-coupling factor transporter ATP-binding protein EcfA2
VLTPHIAGAMGRECRRMGRCMIEEFDRWQRDEPMLWGTRGMIGRTLSAIEACADSDLSSRRRTLNPDETYKEERTYKFDENGADLDRLAQRLLRDGDNLYLALEHLRSRKILKSVSFKLARKDRSRFDFDHLSEGEKQILAVIGGLTLANQPENLILLDEPDTHLNPQWSWDFTEMLGEALAPARRRGSSTLMTTHDPVMISGLMREEVFVADTRSDGVFKRPIRDPRGQGIGNLICSGEFFGLPSSLDKESQKFLDERLRLSMKLTLTTSDKERLRELNRILEFLSPGISERDPEYAAFLRQRNTSGGHL